MCVGWVGRRKGCPLALPTPPHPAPVSARAARPARALPRPPPAPPPCCSKARKHETEPCPHLLLEVAQQASAEGLVLPLAAAATALPPRLGLSLSVTLLAPSAVLALGAAVLGRAQLRVRGGWGGQRGGGGRAGGCKAGRGEAGAEVGLRGTLNNGPPPPLSPPLPPVLTLCMLGNAWKGG